MRCKLGEVEVSERKASERGLVCASWIRGCVDAWGHGTRSGSKHRQVYLEQVGGVVERLLERPGVVTLVARDPECSALAYGWVCFEPQLELVHWTYTKAAYRRSGLARLLMQEARDAAWERTGAILSGYSMRSLHDALAERAGLSYVPMKGTRRAG
jgi:GNAT superfamily N-acetyltransferase